jgi:hypothetical protein
MASQTTDESAVRSLSKLPMLLPGIKVNTNPTDYHAVQQSRLMRVSDESLGDHPLEVDNARAIVRP